MKSIVRGNGTMAAIQNIILSVKRNLKRFYSNKIRCKKGRIERAKLFGDFFGEGDVTELEHALVGCLHDFEHIEEALQNYDFYHYFGDIDKYEIIRLMS